jgi:hypothetical protein
MLQLLKSASDHALAKDKPQITAAQQSLQERKVMALNTLVHGAYYNGLLDNMTTTARWHADKGRFILWETNMGEPKLNAAPHVADLGVGARFAPLSRQESDGAASHISDFAFETTR